MPDKSTKSESAGDIKHLGTRQLLVQAWDLFLDNYWTLAIAILTHALRNIAMAAVIMLILIKNPICPIVVLLVLLTTSAISFLELPRLCLSIVRGQSVALWTKPDLSVLASWLLATLCVVASLFAGLTLLIIPGLLVALFSSFYGFAIVDGESTIQSIKTSFRISSSSFWQITKIFATCLVLSAVMPLPLAGLTFALDLVLIIALAIIYNTRREMLKHTTVDCVHDQ